MKTSKNTAAFLTEVKTQLDNGNWDFEACNPRSNYADCDKAVNYLSRCKFSVKSIQSELEGCWSDFQYNLKNSNITTHNECVKLAAGMVANALAFNRIARFVKSSYFDFRGENNKWFIDETVIFKIN